MIWYMYCVEKYLVVHQPACPGFTFLTTGCTTNWANLLIASTISTVSDYSVHMLPPTSYSLKSIHLGATHSFPPLSILAAAIATGVIFVPQSWAVLPDLARAQNKWLLCLYFFKPITIVLVGAKHRTQGWFPMKTFLLKLSFLWRSNEVITWLIQSITSLLLLLESHTEWLKTLVLHL